MSKYIKVATNLVDRECLKKGLGDLGLACQENCLAHGWHTAQQADVVVPRAQLPGHCIGDLGFVWDADAGRFKLIIDEMDQRRPEVQRLLGQVAQRHACHRVVGMARQRGLAVSQVQQQGGVLQVVLRGV